eukprot:2518039-Rhodomonas_salina.1
MTSGRAALPALGPATASVSTVCVSPNLLAAITSPVPPARGSPGTVPGGAATPRSSETIAAPRLPRHARA